MSKKDIPSTHEVSSYLHNEYLDWMSQLKEDIKVCIDTIMLGLTTTSCAEGSWKSVMYSRYLDSGQHEGIIPRHHGALD